MFSYALSVRTSFCPSSGFDRVPVSAVCLSVGYVRVFPRAGVFIIPLAFTVSVGIVVACASCRRRLPGQSSLDHCAPVVMRMSDLQTLGEILSAWALHYP